MTLQIQSFLVPCWAMREGHMIVSDVIEKMDFFLFQCQSCGD